GIHHQQHISPCQPHAVEHSARQTTLRSPNFEPDRELAREFAAHLLRAIGAVVINDDDLPPQPGPLQSPDNPRNQERNVLCFAKRRNDDRHVKGTHGNLQNWEPGSSTRREKQNNCDSQKLCPAAQGRLERPRTPGSAVTGGTSIVRTASTDSYPHNTRA